MDSALIRTLASEDRTGPDAGSAHGVHAPFHAGEIAVQALAGSRQAMVEAGSRLIRTQMPEQHRRFFPQLPFLAIGALDREGQPWATLLSGTPGFAYSPDSSSLRVEAVPPRTDPLHGSLVPGARVGILGIELQTRRRNRVNGSIAEIDSNGFLLRVVQSFGNCPQYIRQRTAAAPVLAAPASMETPAAFLDDRAQQQIAAADTFFIASHFDGHGANDTSAGADVSHRGGKPGFVRLDDARTLTWPDFQGNAYFNTLGNLYANPRAGLLFVDFARGDFLHLAGSAEILWDDQTRSGFAGAQRLIRFHIGQMRRVRNALPGAWLDGEASPSVARTGAWKTRPTAQATVLDNDHV
ncbi:MAG: pyridoxamine 5'-phosphate oxidase family protein [Bordetella sp.]|uniref:pyridoxamine 5'-phosphate oxidase family protein n=1 Tax=Bordetella sp. TaxID=28081 RepID=UPI003F7BD0C2